MSGAGKGTNVAALLPHMKVPQSFHGATLEQIDTLLNELYQWAGAYWMPIRVLNQLADVTHGNKPPYHSILPATNHPLDAVLIPKPRATRTGAKIVWRGSMEIEAVLAEIDAGLGKLDKTQIATLTRVAKVLRQAEKLLGDGYASD